MKRRRRAEEQRRARGQREREREDAAVDRDLIELRHVWPEADDGAERPRRGDDARHRRQTCERKALDQHLAHDPPGSGAERRADRELAAPLRRAGEEEARDVRAGDEQHQHDRAEQDEERRARRPRQMLGERHHRRRNPRHRSRVFGGELRGNRAKLLLGAVDRRSRLQPRDNVPVARSKTAALEVLQRLGCPHFARAPALEQIRIEPLRQHANDREGRSSS